MRLLLDTHALLWWLNDDARLGRRAREFISDPGTHVLVSAVSLWEIVVKIRVGKLQADVESIVAAVQDGSFEALDIGPEHLLALARLPFHPDHRDPFDHLPIAQAIAEGATFVSADQHASRYAVQVLPCSAP